jgi:hypothetical protein
VVWFFCLPGDSGIQDFVDFRCRVWFFCLPDDSGICKNGDFDAQKCLWVPQKHRNLKEEEFRCPALGASGMIDNKLLAYVQIQRFKATRSSAH